MQDHSLLEEYGTARHVWDLSSTDLSEIAYNSLLIAEGKSGDVEVPPNTNSTNIPGCRSTFRTNAWRAEHAVVADDTAATRARERLSSLQ